MNCRSISLILSAIGAINWGLVGLADFNLVAYLLGSMPVVVKVIYAVIGISGVYSLYGCIGTCTTECIEDDTRHTAGKRKF
jgi:uncharacterized protein